LRAMPAKATSVLSRTGWLSRTPKNFRDAVLEACLCYAMSPGRAITHGGEDTGGMFSIVTGTAGVYSAIGSSDGPLIHIAGPAFLVWAFSNYRWPSPDHFRHRTNTMSRCPSPPSRASNLIGSKSRNVAVAEFTIDRERRTCCPGAR